MADFKFVRNIFGFSPATMDVIIANSATLVVGDMVHLEDANVADRALAGEPLAGVCVGIVSKNGMPLDNLDSANDYDGTYTAGGIGTQTYVAASDNVTDKKVKAKIQVTPGDVWSDVPDATLGTTAGSDSLGFYTNIISGADSKPDESGASTAVAQLAIVGIDPEDTTRGLYTIKMSQFLAE